MGDDEVLIYHEDEYHCAVCDLETHDYDSDDHTCLDKECLDFGEIFGTCLDQNKPVCSAEGKCIACDDGEYLLKDGDDYVCGSCEGEKPIYDDELLVCYNCAEREMVFNSTLDKCVECTY